MGRSEGRVSSLSNHCGPRWTCARVGMESEWKTQLRTLCDGSSGTRDPGKHRRTNRVLSHRRGDLRRAILVLHRVCKRVSKILPNRVMSDVRDRMSEGGWGEEPGASRRGARPSDMTASIFATIAPTLGAAYDSCAFFFEFPDANWGKMA